MIVLGQHFDHRCIGVGRACALRHQHFGDASELGGLGSDGGGILAQHQKLDWAQFADRMDHAGGGGREPAEIVIGDDEYTHHSASIWEISAAI